MDKTKISFLLNRLAINIDEHCDVKETTDVDDYGNILKEVYVNKFKISNVPYTLIEEDFVNAGYTVSLSCLHFHALLEISDSKTQELVMVHGTHESMSEFFTLVQLTNPELLEDK